MQCNSEVSCEVILFGRQDNSDETSHSGGPVRIQLTEDLKDEAILAIMKHGLESKSPEASREWKNRQTRWHNEPRSIYEREKSEAREEMPKEMIRLINASRRAIANSIMEKFPYVKGLSSYLTLSKFSLFENASARTA